MADKTLADGLITLIKSEANNNPPPLLCTITHIYNNSNYVDIKISDTDEIIKYVLCIGDNSVNNNGVVVFIRGDENKPAVISDNQNLIRRIENLEDSG